MAIRSVKTGLFSRSMLVGNSYYVPPAFEWIDSTTASGGESNLTFSSIPQTYKHLQLRGIGRDTNTGAGFSTSIRCTFNGDTAANYAYHRIFGNANNTVTSVGAINSSFWTGEGAILLDGSGLPINTTNMFGAIISDIHDYSSTSKFKTITSIGGGNNNGQTTDTVIAISSGMWKSTSAITSLNITTYDKFGAGTTYSLYGIKG